MVHIIPLFVGERRLDTGNVVQYPDSSPVGEAVQQLGDRWQAAAERYEQRKAQQEAFDTEIAARRLNGQLAQAEAESVANSPADGAGLHDAMYGQVNPYTGQVVKTGLFDTLFGNFLKQVPPELRAGLAGRKEALREAGSIRMAGQQNQRRKQYEQDQVAEVHTAELNNIAQSDPNDTAAFDASRQAGLDLISNMDLDPRAKALAEADWLARTAKERMQTLIAQDPRRAAEMLSAGPVASDGMGETVRSQLGAAGRDEQAAAKGDWRRKKTPDEVIAQAFRDDVPQEEQATMARQARATDAAQQVDMRSSIALAERNAPAIIRKTGAYNGPIPSEAKFVALYGATEGGRRFQALSNALEISHRYHDMLTMPNDAVRAMVANSQPKPDSATPAEDKARHEAIVAAADLTFEARQGDPGGYVREAFKNLDAAWNNISKPEDYQAAIIGSIAAQDQLGFETTQPLPNSVAGDIVNRLRNGIQSQDENPTLSSIFAALPTPAAQQAMLGHLLQTSTAQTRNGVADRTRQEGVVDPLALLDLGNTVELGGSGANAELTNYIPTLQEQFGRFIAGDSPRGSFRRFLAQKLVGSEGLGEEGFSAADVTPLGVAFALDRAGAAALDGRYGDAALEAAGVIPADRLAAPILRHTGKIAEPWVEKLTDFFRGSDELAGEALVHGVDAETLRFQQDLARSPSKSSSSTPKRRLENDMLGAMLARDPTRVRYGGATVGWETSTDYRKTFFDANPKLNPNDYVVHHGIEQQVFNRYPGIFTNEEINSLENLRGVRKDFDDNLHKKVFRREWDEFYAAHPAATRQDILDKVTELDRKYGQLFDPPLGE
jgi:hypothetical protein